MAARWEVATDNGWERFNPGMPFHGRHGEEIRWQHRDRQYRATFTQPDEGVQENLRTGKKRRLRCVEARWKCAKGHDLCRYVRSKEHICDGCGRRGIQAPEHIYRCAECDFDLCQACYGDPPGYYVNMHANPLAVLFTGEDAGCDVDCVRATLDNFGGTNSGSYTLKCQPMRHVKQADLAGASVILVPGGDVWADPGDPPGFGQLAALGRQGSEAVCRAVRDEGAVYIGICAGAFLALELEGFGLAGKVRTVHRKEFGFCAKGERKGNTRLREGSKSVPALLQAMAPMLREAWYQNGPLFQCDESDEIRILATYTSLKDAPKTAQKMYGSAAAVACRVGRGAVILMSPHPEFTPGCHDILPRIATAARLWVNPNQITDRPIGIKYESKEEAPEPSKRDAIQLLADSTGHPLDACFAALVQTHGDVEEAAVLLLENPADARGPYNGSG